MAVIAFGSRFSVGKRIAVGESVVIARCGSRRLRQQSGGQRADDNGTLRSADLGAVGATLAMSPNYGKDQPDVAYPFVYATMRG